MLPNTREYCLLSKKWNKLKCNSDECTRILLVANSQILGETFDKQFYNTLAIFDSDRYLSETFNFALHHGKPNVIVFMGDLMDEGSVAKDQEFQRYVHRFKKLFHVPNDEVTLMYISGDNDVGGENAEDSVTVEKVKRNRLRIFNVLGRALSKERIHLLMLN